MKTIFKKALAGIVLSVVLVAPAFGVQKRGMNKKQKAAIALLATATLAGIAAGADYAAGTGYIVAPAVTTFNDTIAYVSNSEFAAQAAEYSTAALDKAAKIYAAAHANVIKPGLTFGQSLVNDFMHWYKATCPALVGTQCPANFAAPVKIAVPNFVNATLAK